MAKYIGPTQLEKKTSFAILPWNGCPLLTLKNSRLERQTRACSSYVKTEGPTASQTIRRSNSAKLGRALRRWLQDTSKRILADLFYFFRAPPLPVSPGSPEDDPTIDKNKRPGF